MGMNDYLKSIANTIDFVHKENLTLISILTGEDENSEIIKAIQKNFEKTYEGIAKHEHD